MEITAEELKERVQLHRKWRLGEPGGVRLDLSGANLDGASLDGASLDGASLDGASLVRASLVRASLYGASLYGANLDGANLEGATLPHFSNIPEEGAFIAWKKVICSGSYERAILKLQVPEDARRVSSLIGRKCRADKLLVLAAEDLDGNPIEGEFISQHDHKFTYRIGETVSVSDFCDDIRQECRPGLHFFITKREALAY